MAMFVHAILMGFDYMDTLHSRNIHFPKTIQLSISCMFYTRSRFDRNELV